MPASLLIPPLLFFLLGAFAQLVRSDLKFPPDLQRALSIYLLIGIGLHGGTELAHANLVTALQSVLAALIMGFGLPLLAYGMLSRLLWLDPLNSAAIAAHYGSVSAGTFLTAIAYLQSRHIPYEEYPVIMLAIMEAPAIVVGVLLAQRARNAAGRDPSALSAPPTGVSWRSLLLGAVTHGSVVLLIGTMLIGAIAAPKGLDDIEPFFRSVFMGVLCLFLLELGMDAAKRLGEFRQLSGRFIAFGLAMPLVGAVIGLGIGHFWLQFGAGGTTLVAVLAASASYIAVPPAMRLAIPEANPTFYLTLSIGITFPFNVVVGIPLYLQIATWLTNGAHP